MTLAMVDPDATATPVPTSGNSGLRVRRVVLFERASAALGAEKLGAALGISRHAVNHKIAVDRGLSDVDLVMSADALDKRANELMRLAAELRVVAS